MMPRHVNRRLTTILAADVAEYSRLMRADEDATLRGLTACARSSRRWSPSIAAASPTPPATRCLPSSRAPSTVSCARSPCSARSGKQNEDFPPQRRMLFRIGVHCGDVIPRDGDLFGDAVNIAARLQALAEPGEICVSAAVREHVGRPAFRPPSPMPACSRSRTSPSRCMSFRVLPSGAGEARAPQPQHRSALPDKPSIAVLPFQNMSGDPEQEYFADGIVEDIITALSRFEWLFVIARNSSFTYKGKSPSMYAGRARARRALRARRQRAQGGQSHARSPRS